MLYVILLLLFAKSLTVLFPKPFPTSNTVLASLSNVALSNRELRKLKLRL